MKTEKGKFNISFKKEPIPTGLASVGHIQSSKILVNKTEVGWIIGPNLRNNGTSIYIKVTKNDIMEDGNENCVWKNVQLNKDSFLFKTHDEAKQWVKENLKSTLERLPNKLHIDKEA